MATATMSKAFRLVRASSNLSRGIHSSASRNAVSRFSMPAMSPTMTEGGIASWKVKEGESFSVGDILLEIETDKAVMDVEAQEDGVLGKILVPDGSKGVPVGKLIAVFAEEGDDLSKIEIPAEDSTPSAPKESASPAPAASTSSSGAPAPPPTLSPNHDSHGTPHSSKPLFPSVIRLLQENGLSSDVDSLGIKGTGIRGMLTKGDILAYLGKASGANGTYKIPPTKYGVDLKTVGSGVDAAKAPTPPLDGDSLRRAILAGLTKSTKPEPVPEPEATFDSILADYYPRVASNKASVLPPKPDAKPPSSDYLGGLI